MGRRTYRNPAVLRFFGLACVGLSTAALLRFRQTGGVVIVALSVGFFVLRVIRPKVVATESGLTVVNLRSRRWNWSEVDDLSVGRRGSGLSLWLTAGGERVPCWAFDSWQTGASRKWFDEASSDVIGRWRRAAGRGG
jgi:hypothetical protein